MRISHLINAMRWIQNELLTFKINHQHFKSTWQTTDSQLKEKYLLPQPSSYDFKVGFVGFEDVFPEH